jgi:hypothetical protein
MEEVGNWGCALERYTLNRSFPLSLISGRYEVNSFSMSCLSVLMFFLTTGLKAM